MRTRKHFPPLASFFETSLFFIIICALCLRGAAAPVFFHPVAAAVLLLAAIWLLAANHEVAQKPKPTGMEAPIAVFAGWLVLTGFFSENIHASLLELEKLIVITLLFYMIVSHYRSKEKIRWLCYGFYMLGILCALYGLTAYFSGLSDPLDFTGNPRNDKSVTGTLVNHNNFAALMEVSFFLGLGLVGSVRPQRGEPLSEHFFRMLLVSLPLPVLVVAMIFSLSRGGWFGLSLGILIWMIWLMFSPSRSGSTKRPMKIPIIVALNIFFIILILVYIKKEAVIDRVRTLEVSARMEDEVTLPGRFLIWKSALSMVRGHPFLGTGPGTFHDAYPRYRGKGLNRGVVFAHNDYLQMASETGIVGLAIFLWILFRLAWRSLVIYRLTTDPFLKSVKKGIMVGMAVLLIHDFFEFHLHIPALAFLFTGFAAILLREDHKE